MRPSFSTTLVLLLIGSIHSVLTQPLPVNFIIDTSRDTLSISPFIYGTNGQSEDRDANITARRIGGNRLTGYNWENNASNMGMDYNQSNANDNYLTWVAGIAQESVPGIVLTTFHDSSRAMGCYSLITLPAAGYVSRDKNGPVGLGETAPSPRFRQVRMSKGTPFSLQPDTTDADVYVDEEVNFLVSKYGGAATALGVRGYAVDNEPALWPSTHPRIHPGQTTCAEVIEKNSALAKSVKAVDPDAELFGGVFYGFNEQYNMQQAPDWSSYSRYGRYANAFLANLRDSSAVAGKRLLDVLDLHWYPDLDSAVALNENADSLHAFLRMQVPRSLWDSSYVEPGWIGKWFSPVSLIPNMKTSIANYYPGTRLAITEYNYGGSTHISGGIAVTDVLGIFGKYGVYFASHWGAVQGYVKSAFQIFRNYDGSRSTFGDISLYSSTSDRSNSSIYASLRSSDPSKMDLIVINKHFTRPITGSFTVLGPRQYHSAESFGFDAASPTITPRSGITSITGNQYGYTIPPLSVVHMVLSTPAVSADEEPGTPLRFTLEQNYPNPFNPTTVVRYQVSGNSNVRLAVYDLLGREVALLVNERKAPGSYSVRFDGSRLASGMYLYRLRAGTFVQTRTMAFVK
jgi:Glycoside hydrolase family 44/Secretion system C-terminal sorting domain